MNTLAGWVAQPPDRSAYRSRQPVRTARAPPSAPGHFGVLPPGVDARPGGAPPGVLAGCRPPSDDRRRSGGEHRAVLTRPIERERDMTLTDDRRSRTAPPG